jgi:predicted DsbA family dithiol-disulfide isomerase
VEVEWMPYELRPYPNETLKPEGDYLQTTWKNYVYPMADRFGIKMVLPNVSPQPYTHLAFEPEVEYPSTLDHIVAAAGG